LWLAGQSLFGLVNALDVAHQNYVGSRFILIGSDKPCEISLNLSSAIPYALGLGVAELLFFVLVEKMQFLVPILGLSSKIDSLADFGSMLILWSTCWLVVGSAGGLLGRVLIPFGHYPKVTLWGAWYSFTTSVAPAVAVSFGAGLIGASIVFAGGMVLFNIPVYSGFYVLARRTDLTWQRPDLDLGFRNLRAALALWGKLLVEMFRQQGVRVVLVPIIGVSGLATFATIRTLANVLYQGVTTLLNPLVPEVFLATGVHRLKNIEYCFSGIWLFSISAFSACLIALQLIMPNVFEVWTKHRITFDPLTYAILCGEVSVFLIGSPLRLVLQGFNLVKAQLLQSMLAGGIAIGAMVMLTPLFDLRGAAIALVAGEFGGLLSSIFIVRRWMREQAMVWPQRQLFFVSASQVIAFVGALLIGLKPQYGLLLACTALSLNIGIAFLFWPTMPAQMRHKVGDMIFRVIQTGRKPLAR